MINLGVEEMIKQWIMENIPDFNTKIRSEERRVGKECRL